MMAEITRSAVRKAEAKHAAALCAKLTRRERDVLVLLGKGLTVKQAGVALGISDHTVTYYTRGMRNKLDVGTTAESLVVATKAGLL